MSQDHVSVSVSVSYVSVTCQCHASRVMCQCHVSLSCVPVMCQVLHGLHWSTQMQTSAASPLARHAWLTRSSARPSTAWWALPYAWFTALTLCQLCLPHSCECALCCAVLALPCCAVLRCAVLCSPVLCSPVLSCAGFAVPCCAVLCCAVPCRLCRAAVCCGVLHHAVL